MTEVDVRRHVAAVLEVLGLAALVAAAFAGLGGVGGLAAAGIALLVYGVALGAER